MLYDKKWDAPKMDLIGNVLMKAADLIRKHGLAKNIRHDENGSFCIHGAIQHVLQESGSRDDWHGREMGVTKYLQEYLRGAGHALPKPYYYGTLASHDCATWNNAPERTADEVVNVMEAAARLRVADCISA